MEKILISLILLFSLKCYSQNNADAIIGKWLKTSKEDLIIEVYKTNNEYRGKINWAKNKDKRKPVGFVILEKLKYNSKNKMWENGTIHDPNSGRTYNATAKINTDGSLEVHAYRGMKFLGTKKYFKRVK